MNGNKHFLRIVTQLILMHCAVNQQLYSKDKCKIIHQFIGKIGLIIHKSLINFFSYHLFLFLIRIKNGNKSIGNEYTAFKNTVFLLSKHSLNEIQAKMYCSIYFALQKHCFVLLWPPSAKWAGIYLGSLLSKEVRQSCYSVRCSGFTRSLHLQ